MKSTKALRFILQDRINNNDVGLGYMPFKLLGEFHQNVGDFLRGSKTDINLDEVNLSIESGSLILQATGLDAKSSLWADVQALVSSNSLETIDPKRAEIFEYWQLQAKNNPARSYSLNDDANTLQVTVNASSGFRQRADVWVAVEKYLYGQILRWGGKTRSSIYFETDDGKTITVAASQALLEQEEKNLLYKTVMLHVTAEENLISGQLRNYRLLAFKQHQPTYNETEFSEMVRKGTKAWSGVPNATKWLEDLRGG